MKSANLINIKPRVLRIFVSNFLRNYIIRLYSSTHELYELYRQHQKNHFVETPAIHTFV